MGHHYCGVVDEERVGLRACPSSARDAKTLAVVAGNTATHHGFVNALLQKYFPSRLTQITSLIRPVLSHRGAYRDRHGRGMGCGGRGSVERVT